MLYSHLLERYIAEQPLDQCNDTGYTAVDTCSYHSFAPARLPVDYPAATVGANSFFGVSGK